MRYNTRGKGRAKPKQDEERPEISQKGSASVFKCTGAVLRGQAGEKGQREREKEGKLLSIV